MNAIRIRSRIVPGSLTPLALVAVLLAGSAWSEARSVILLIGDGMGPQAVRAASIKLHGADGKTAMHGMPVKGSLSTKPVGGDVTDSAAAATAMATGHKTRNGRVAVGPDGKVLRTILEACHDAGKMTGLVATSSVTHATPACFGSHVENRGAEYDIAGQLIAHRVNVILGGGKSFFLEPRGEAWIGVEIRDAKGEKIGGYAELMRGGEDGAVERRFMTPPGAASAYLWIWRGSSLDAFFDDFKIDPKEGESATRLVNADFEKGDATGWNVWNGCTVVNDGGSMALKVSGNGGCDQTVAVDPGREYEFSYRGRIPNPYAGQSAKKLPWDEALTAGYRRIEKREEVAGAAGPYLLGLFAPAGLEGKPGEPALPEMAGKAFDLLDASPKGFFLMVEGSQIDWAAGDESYWFRELESFDNAVASALEYAKKKGDVLVVATADHETGGVAIEGTDAASLKVSFTGKGHTATDVPLFAFGPGSKAFAGRHPNTDVAKLIAKALGLSF